MSSQQAMQRPRPKHTLKRRLMLAFALFALCLMTLFTLYALAFAYTVEDAYLEQGLEMEAERQLAAQSEQGQWLRPVDHNTQLLVGDSKFPAAVKLALVENPKRREVAGENGRHYHLLRIREQPQSVWLLAEVSDRLVFRRMRAGVAKIIGWSAGIAMLTALLIGWLIARRTTEPLSRLVDAVTAIEPGQLPETRTLQRAGGMRDDEVGILSRSLDDMVQRVGAFVEREQEFTRDVSHELRTPLSVIRSAGERLAADPDLKPQARDQLSAIRQSGARLEQVIGTLLGLAREPDPALAPVKIELLPVLEQAVVEQATWHDDPSLDLQIDVASGTQIAIEEGVLQVLLSNLIGNAMSHAQADAENVRRVRIEVKDSRLCISNPSQSRLRDEDFQSHQKGPRSTGFGLGLSIVRRLCERLGIDLRVEHEDGSVTISLPVSKAAL